MKYILIFATFLLSYSSFCQQKQNAITEIKLIDNSSTAPVELTVKRNKRIVLKTTTGERYSFREYSLVGDSAIVSQGDTVLLKNVAVLKGNVKGDALRKVVGWVLVGTGTFAAFYGSVTGVLSIAFGGSGVVLLYPLVAAGVCIYGAHLVDSRRFNTSNKWSLKIVAREGGKTTTATEN